MQLFSTRPNHVSLPKAFPARPLHPESIPPVRAGHSETVRPGNMDTVRPPVSGHPRALSTPRQGSVGAGAGQRGYPRVQSIALCPVDPDLPRDIASRFGRRVRELRHAKRMTQMEVAVTFGIDRTFISDVERGRKSVCLPTIEVFALGFGVSLSDLLRGL